MSTVTDRPKSAAATKPKAVLQSIGHYDLEKNIGEGNFAKVRLAKHTISGQQVYPTTDIGGNQNHRQE